MRRGSVLPQPMPDVDVQSCLDDGGAAYAVHDEHIIPALTDGPHGDREPIDLSTMSSNAAFHEVVSRLRDVDLCDECGKTRVVLNIGPYRRPMLERVSAATHCACAGGPAYAGVGSAR